MTDGLTSRQRAVLALVATGATNAEIAAALGLGEETVRSHLKRAYEALGCDAGGQNNRVQAAVWPKPSSAGCSTVSTSPTWSRPGS